jgi:hypothetical protein
MNLDKYTELTDISFEHEGAHIAVVHALQGGAANNWHDALITKATSDITDEAIQKALESPDTLNGSSDEQETEASASESKPESEGVTKAEADNQNNVGEKMTDNVNVEAELLKAKEDEIALLKEALEKANSAAAELEELRKAKAQAEHEAAKAQYMDLVKGYSFVAEGDQSQLAEAMLKASNTEFGEILLDTLEKAREAVKAAACISVGVDGEGKVEIGKSTSLAAKLKDKYRNNEQ